jgi:uncharacterized protein (DUF2384 family)
MLLLNLTQMESLMYKEIVTAAIDVFGNRTAAIEWFKSPNTMLDGDTPFEHSCTDSGAHKVLGVLRNMKHGLSY